MEKPSKSSRAALPIWSATSSVSTRVIFVLQPCTYIFSVKTISKINPKNSQTQDFDLRLGKACQLEAHTKNLTIGGRAPRTLGVESILGRFVVANRPLFPELDLCQLSDRFLEFDGRPIR